MSQHIKPGPSGALVVLMASVAGSLRAASVGVVGLTIVNGRRLVEYRTDITVRAVQESIATR